MAKFYRIKSITDLDGYDRDDGRYPMRIGRVCWFPLGVHTERRLVVQYYENADGTPNDGWMSTSTVTEFDMSADSVVVYTLNSIYTFEPVKDGWSC